MKNENILLSILGAAEEVLVPTFHGIAYIAKYI